MLPKLVTLHIMILSLESTGAALPPTSLFYVILALLCAICTLTVYLLSRCSFPLHLPPYVFSHHHHTLPSPLVTTTSVYYIFLFIYIFHLFVGGIYTLPFTHFHFASTCPISSIPQSLVKLNSFYYIFQKRSALLLLKRQHGNKRPFDLNTTSSLQTDLLIQTNIELILFYFDVDRLMPCKFTQKNGNLFRVVKIFLLFLFFYFFNQNHPT